MSIWKSYSELNIILKNKKKIYLFGRSEDWTSKVLRKIQKNLNTTIVDNNKNYHNKKYLGIKIVSPKILDKKKFKDSYIVICAEPDSIIEELKNKNFIEGQDYCCSPDLIDWSHLQNLKKDSSKILVSSSDYFNLSRSRGSKNGGGIFLCNHFNNKIEKKIDGQFRQMIEIDNLIYAVEYVQKKVFVINKDFKIINKYELDQSKNKSEKPNYCGITYYPKKKYFYIANSASDIISVYENKKFKKIDEIEFSDKGKMIADGQCHINDLTIMEDFLLISYFSECGLWKKGIFDGGVTEINLKNNKRSKIISDLKQPHSPEYIDNKICILDSMNRTLLIGNSVKASFSGFLRGLAHDGKYFYIGQSEDMYTSQHFGSNLRNTMCNAGIYKVDLTKNISRFISMYDNMNIHDILIYS